MQHPSVGASSIQVCASPRLTVGDWTYPPIPPLSCSYLCQRRPVGGWRTVLLYEFAPHVALLEGMCQADNPLISNVNHCNVDEYKLDVYN